MNVLSISQTRVQVTPICGTKLKPCSYALSSLSASYQKFIGPRGFVAPLSGKVFVDRWGGKTAAELIARFQETVDDPVLKFEGMNDETTVNITAYVLQVNGAKAGAQPLTRTTGVIVSSITR